MKKTHPLLDNDRWRFSQPDLGFEAEYTAISKADGKKKTHKISTTNTCREGIINNVRASFMQQVTNLKSLQEGGWRKGGRIEMAADVDLTEKKRKKAVVLRIQWYKGWMGHFPGGDTFPAETFLQVCDVVMGPVCVLLGPWRAQGDWWKTSPDDAKYRFGRNGNDYVHWKGSDNWFLAHPATMGIATGLYRQCYHLCGAGLAPEILKTLDPGEVDEVMSTGSQKLALRLVKRTRPYIEVPAGCGASRVNYAFTLGFWRRLIRLQRAIRHHGYEKALGQDFSEGWCLLGKGTEWSGLWRFWGDEGQLTDHHRHLMKMGAPRRATSGSKPATKNS